MNKFVFLTSVAAFTLASGVAGAVTLKNTDKAETTVSSEIGGKKEELKLKENGTFDSKGKDVSFTLGKEKPVVGKGDENFIIKGGKIELVKVEAATTPAVEPVKIDAVKVDAKPEVVKTVTPEVAKPADTKAK